MKKRQIIPVLFLAGLLLLASCGSKDGNSDAVFSNLTSEQHKQSIEQSGTQMVDQIDGMKNLSAVQLLIDFANLTDNVGMQAAPAVRSFVLPFSQIGESPTKMLAFSPMVISKKTLVDLFNDYTGVYTYNKNLLKWEKTANSSEVTYIFPSNNSSANNASVTLSNFSSSTSPRIINLGDYNGVLINSLTMVVKSGANEVVRYTMTGAYNSDGLPSKLNESLSFKEGYVFTTSFVDNGTTVSFDESLTSPTANIFSCHFDSNGDFGYNNIDYNWSSSSDNAISNVINSGNVWMAVGNIKVGGQVDLKSIFAEKPTTIDDTKKMDVDNEVAILNKYTKIYAKYQDKNEIIAQSVFYTVPDTYSYWNYSTQKYVTTTTYYSEIKFVFKDGSSMDESFFNSGFDTFTNRLSDFSTAVQNSYQR